ncbi:hypothetical protein GCM10008982_24070 [Anoxybacillus voinovskiensis]|nr:hypothetical protein GCM10008982_24070 [Anoxybacillus voinovskiensis]
MQKKLYKEHRIAFWTPILFREKNHNFFRNRRSRPSINKGKLFIMNGMYFMHSFIYSEYYIERECRM